MKLDHQRKNKTKQKKMRRKEKKRKEKKCNPSDGGNE
jgi:hypothetical protein